MIKKTFLPVFKQLLLFSLLFGFVLGVNFSIISLDWMYPEQPLMYIANQTIHSGSDLLNIYLHPKMLHIFSVPFFRPSGHFLIYQILMPFLGWHNTQALVMSNLFFLSLTGYVIIKLYALLFPHFRAGGYIAFGIYLMHPALILSRLIVLHFEFAYVFFLTLSLYCFARFCQKNNFADKSYSLLGISLALYALAVTFKEPAIILGPILAMYFVVALYAGGPLVKFFHQILKNKLALQILFLIMLVTFMLVIYLTLPWPSLSHPLQKGIDLHEKWAATKEFMTTLFILPHNFLARSVVYQKNLIWRDIFFPPAACFFVWALFIATVISIGKLLIHPSARETFIYKKSLFFLFISALLSLILPINWGMGLPWHLSLTILSCALMMGFSCEYLTSQILLNHQRVNAFCMCIAILVGITTVTVNKGNIKHITEQKAFALTLSLGRNAVLHPPDIKSKLNADSVLVVEDSILQNSYALGNSGNAFPVMGAFGFDVLNKIQSLSLLQYQSIYNGNLFKWAYLLPALQEEVYPFQVEQLQKVPDVILYGWLQHANNIYCLGYDEQAQWHDKTVAFRKNIQIEKEKRYLQVHPYDVISATTFQGNIIDVKQITFPEHQLCQQECDKNTQCAGFTYLSSDDAYHSSATCEFFDSVAVSSKIPCAGCMAFVKII